MVPIPLWSILKRLPTKTRISAQPFGQENTLQLTLMSINAGDDIGLEVHTDHDQFIRIEEGEGIVKMGDCKDKLDFQKS